MMKWYIDGIQQDITVENIHLVRNSDLTYLLVVVTQLNTRKEKYGRVTAEVLEEIKMYDDLRDIIVKELNERLNTGDVCMGIKRGG